MATLTILIDHLGHKELKDYLKSLNGILNVEITNNNYLIIILKYNPNIISIDMIKNEILLFLNILKIPSIISFDKHSNEHLKEYQIIRNNICCEYCFKGAIEDLLSIKGIERVDNNFDKLCKNIVINVKYDMNALDISDLKEIELKLNI